MSSKIALDKQFQLLIHNITHNQHHKPIENCKAYTGTVFQQPTDCQPFFGLRHLCQDKKVCLRTLLGGLDA